ncbi:MAG: L-glutamate gamma-semialdehyde dehydrogenase [Chitinophagaceae bacterium]|nr:L-glutamate gamma-semialdehyde dehydrogenase [Chitinophagaceae bacterium]
MSNGHFNLPQPQNETVMSFAPKSAEKIALKKALADAKKIKVDIPMYIGNEEVRTGKKFEIRPPHETKHLLGHFHMGDASHVKKAIDAALSVKKSWENMPWKQKASIFLKAADLLATKYRYEMLAATMLGQSKNAFQAEIDCTCELIDFLRFNVYFLNEIYQQQPASGIGMHNRLEYRALEGFILAVTPFNFTAIGGNLPTSAAMCGNVVVWKAANTQVYSANVFMKILKEAGLPDGVINLVHANGPTVGEICFNHRDFAGVHFTGSTGVFNSMWKIIGENIPKYKSYPRIVGETGGKDFVMVHPSANPKEVSTALSRGAFEYQGQKCSAASRAYLPKSLSKEIIKNLLADIKSMKMGSTEDFTNFVNAVIDEKSFNNIKNYIEFAKKDKTAKILIGGKCDSKKGWYVEPTVIETSNPKFKTMCEEIFGPVLTIFVYEDADFEKTCHLVDETSDYALTGAVFSKDRYALEKAMQILEHSAGNFYINDKPSGAVVGQQPFGGARGSGTNDKAGSMLNLYRWLSARTIKETFNPPTDYRYAFLGEK